METISFDTKILIDIRNFFFQVLFIPFREAAHYINMVNQAFFLGPDETQNRIHGFLFGILDKSACIDNDGLVPKGFGIMNNCQVIGIDLLHQEFRVHHIF